MSLGRSQVHVARGGDLLLAALRSPDRLSVASGLHEAVSFVPFDMPFGRAVGCGWPGSTASGALTDGAGPMALDPGKQRFMIRQRALLAHDVADLHKAQAELLTVPSLTLGWAPVDLAIDLAARRLYMTLLDASASPPHQHEMYRAYDLEPFAEADRMEAHLGTLDRPSSASSADRMVSGMYAKNGLLGSHLSLYDKQGALLRRQGPVEGIARIDPPESASTSCGSAACGSCVRAT